MVKKYSVIVPVYNSQGTLNRCINSLIKEKRNDVEIIMVDDGSKDSSGKICDKFASKYSQCRVIHKKNGGVSTARNAGLDYAEGQYVIFVDSDDYVAKHCFALIDEVLNQNKYDYIIFSYRQVSMQSQKVFRKNTFETKDGSELYKKIREIISNKTINAPWAKVFRRDLIEQYHIRFPEGIHIGEDYVFNMAYAMHIKSLKTSDIILYSVDARNENSLSRSQHADLKEQLRKVDEEIQKLYETCGLEKWKLQFYKDAVDYYRYCDVYSESKRMHLASVSFFKRYQFIYDQCKQLSGKNYWYPDSFFCWLIVFIIKHKMVILIDIAGAYYACQN